MKRQGTLREEDSAIALVEETFQCLRTAPVGVLARYYVGTIPFVLALVYYFFDMWLHAFAEERAEAGALMLVFLFIWMKTWQTLFANRLYAWACDAPLPAPSMRRTLRIAFRQTIVQASGIILLPFAMLFVAPFGVCYATYQNLTVLDDGDTGSTPRGLFGAAVAQARERGRQSHVIIWLLSPFLVAFTAIVWRLILPVMNAASPEWFEGYLYLYGVVLLFLLIPLCPFGVFVAANIAMALIFGPSLLRMLFGIQTNYSIVGLGEATPLIFVVCALTYLCLDPLLKGAYVLRCFYGRSRESGEDLIVELRRLGKDGAILLLLVGAFVLGGVAQAQNSASPAKVDSQGAGAVGPGQLDQALNEVLEDRRYAWRAPRIERMAPDDNWLASAIEGINDRLSRGARGVTDWIRKQWDSLAGGEGAPGDGAESNVKFRYLIYALIAVLTLVVAYFAWRAWRRRPPDPEIVAKAVAILPDLEDESTTAADLAVEGWLKLAGEMMDKGEKRLAMRALFLAGLARLADLDMIRIARYKSNREYGRELQRVVHEHPTLPERYTTGMHMFESVWYGLHEITAESFKKFAAIQEGIKPHAE